MAEGKNDSQNTISTAYHPGLAIRYILEDTLQRLHIILYRISCLPVVFISALIPKATAFPAASQSSRSNSSDSLDADIIADAKTLLENLSWRDWSKVASSIRKGSNRFTCNQRLSLALSTSGSLAAASSSAAAGALTLLPTAGALIGSPTKELWVVYKLMPLAGILSMLLSLGGSIVPSNASDYELNPGTFSYGGMIATEQDKQDAEPKPDIKRQGLPEEKVFADKVKLRSEDLLGGKKFARVWCGIGLQILFIAILLVACWFTQSGAILVWWCKAWGWMFFWYIMVAISSLLENLASVPFTHQWTLRISRDPQVRISGLAPLVAKTSSAPNTPNEKPHDSNIQKMSPLNVEIHEDVPLNQISHHSNCETATLDALESGYNVKGEVFRDQKEPWSSSLVPFYVIISLQSVSNSHAFLRVISKAISVAVFAAGTAIFASAQLLSITVALTTLCLVLSAGVFGRVVAMWMASEMMKTEPLMHRVVKRREIASRFIDEILDIDGLTVEILGHIIINRRCVARFNTWMCWSRWFGILAGPYNVSKLST